jgi:hypothetical protein
MYKKFNFKPILTSFTNRLVVLSIFLLNTLLLPVFVQSFLCGPVQIVDILLYKWQGICVIRNDINDFVRNQSEHCTATAVSTIDFLNRWELRQRFHYLRDIHKRNSSLFCLDVAINLCIRATAVMSLLKHNIFNLVLCRRFI